MAQEFALTLGAVSVRQLDGLFSLNDLHAAAGGARKDRPGYFLTTDQAKALIAEIETAGFPAVRSGEGRNGGTYARRELVIAYAAWISAAFHLKVIRVFLDAAAPAPTPTPPTAAPALPSNRLIEQQRATEVAQQVSTRVRRSVYRALLKARGPEGVTRRFLVEVDTGADGEPRVTARHLAADVEIGTWAELAQSMRQKADAPSLVVAQAVAEAAAMASLGIVLYGQGGRGRELAEQVRRENLGLADLQALLSGVALDQAAAVKRIARRPKATMVAPALPAPPQAPNVPVEPQTTAKTP